MAFPPRFLDELRERVTLSEEIGRRIRVIRAGREFKACCPFHHEKTPSFTINDQKGFFHCFGCGAHGDVIGFVMRHDNLSFPEAVERLAAVAGVEVPQSTPEDRQRHERQKTLHDLVERACAFYETKLREAGGRGAMGYLSSRGLSGEAIGRFRLGYAPADRHLLVRQLVAEGFSEEDLVTAGLARRPDDGGPAYSFFRHRVMFPVADRRGRVVAFGGRLMDGDGPKYINTSETPLFHKGSLLYGLSRARQAAADGQPVVVAEGYMDVIALVEAGFAGAVAPLGTALTESQIQELWKLIPAAEKEPILCFDGDGAGRRAAWRAVERILPHIGPGKSARVAFLPEGDDPDSLIRQHGPRAMTAVLEGAIPLSEALWRMELEGRRLDTPETKAALRAALDERVNGIQDATVREFYRQDVRRRVAEALNPPREAGFQRGAWNGGVRAGGGGGNWKGGGGRFGGPPRRHVPGTEGARTAPPPGTRPSPPSRLTADLHRERLLLAAVINHPTLFDEVGEALGLLTLPPGPLDELRVALLSALGDDSGLDVAELCRHLASHGHDRTLDDLLGEQTYCHGAFARPDAPLDESRRKWFIAWRQVRRPMALRDMEAARAALGREANDENQARFDALLAEVNRLNASLSDEAGEDEAGEPS